MRSSSVPPVMGPASSPCRAVRSTTSSSRFTGTSTWAVSVCTSLRTRAWPATSVWLVHVEDLFAGHHLAAVVVALLGLRVGGVLGLAAVVVVGVGVVEDAVRLLPAGGAALHGDDSAAAFELAVIVVRLFLGGCPSRPTPRPARRRRRPRRRWRRRRPAPPPAITGPIAGNAPATMAQTPQRPGAQPGRGPGDGALLGHRLFVLLGEGAFLIAGGDADLVVGEAGGLQFVDGPLGFGVGMKHADDGFAGGAVGGGGRHSWS